MKRCITCKAEKPADQFYADRRNRDSLKSQCKRCHCATSVATRDPDAHRAATRASAARQRLVNPERARARERAASKCRIRTAKTIARASLNAAIGLGLIQRPASCSACKLVTRVHGHHDNYEHPLQVRWVCPQCHADIHRLEK